MKVNNEPCTYRLSKGALLTRQGFQGYSCPRQAELHQRFCIFHNPSPDKDEKMFHFQFQNESDCNFTGFVFPRGFCFQRTAFKDTDFASSHFHGPVDFCGAEFTGETGFEMSRFELGARFDKASFLGNASFSGATFLADVSFNETNLHGYVGFKGTTFMGDFWLAGVRDVVTDLTGALFKGNACFHSTDFASASFIETQFEGQAIFGYYKYYGSSPDWGEAIKSPDVVFFEGVDMRNLLFREANLSNASFNQCYYLDRAKFYECTWNSDSNRKNVLFDELQLRGRVVSWEEMAVAEARSRKCNLTEETSESSRESEESIDSSMEGKYAAVEETCRALKKHFEDRRNYLVAGDFHEGEMEMRRLAKGPWGRNILSVEAIYWLLSRYGQSWLRPLTIFIAMNLTAAVIYSFSGLQLESDRAPIRLVITTETSLILVLESLYVYLHALLYSFSVSALLRGVYATPTNLVGLFLQTVQFVVGPLLILLIGLAIRRRVRR